MTAPIPRTDDEKQALLGLWTIPGVGPQALATLRAKAGDLTSLLDARPFEWATEFGLPSSLALQLADARPLRVIAEIERERCDARGIGIAFEGDVAYPSKLSTIADAPPVLFFRGTPAMPRRRVAMVGSRRVEHHERELARRFAAAVAEIGVCVISGAAYGVDRACHEGALSVDEVTWAFLGSGLDEIDAGQLAVCRAIYSGGGMLYSEYPSGVRANKQSFPRRNRLITGSADAVLIVRADENSGTMHTANYATEQGRPLFTFASSEFPSDSLRGCHRLLKQGRARLCDSPMDLWEAIGLDVSRKGIPPRPPKKAPWETLSAETKATYDTLHHGARHSFESLQDRSGFDAAVLTSALVELELLGLAVQHPGQQYERV